MTQQEKQIVFISLDLGQLSDNSNFFQIVLSIQNVILDESHLVLNEVL